MDFLCHHASPLGGITLAGSGDALTGLWFDGQAHFGCTGTGCIVLPDAVAGPACVELQDVTAGTALPVFDDACRWLDIYFSGTEPDFTPRLDLRGTPFQLAVWKQLLAIPYGHIVTYSELARRLGASPQAVGGAVGRNPVSLIVPCHRVVGAGGRLTGYAGGLDRKARLLQLEQADLFFGI
ncbi:MAG: methylated-DNA--[protein]-cysteine S-methyltransferase [Bacteroidales bacterium]|nr:methylated-DNA--[protein]-cysteine S-methyltransferase [Bacteroidales bacterium]